MQHPPVNPVLPSHTGFGLEGFPNPYRRPELLQKSISVFGMNSGSPLPTLDVIQRNAQVIQPTLIKIVARTIRLCAMHHGGNCIKSEPKKVQVTPFKSTKSRLGFVFDSWLHGFSKFLWEGQRPPTLTSQSLATGASLAKDN